MLSAQDTSRCGRRGSWRAFVCRRWRRSLSSSRLPLLADNLLFGGDRFAAVSPHPFWIVVLLIAAQYGTSEALAAAALASAALLFDNLPEQAFNEDLYAWLLRVSVNPVLWCIAAVTLGEIRAGHRRKAETLQEEMAEAQEQARAIAEAYEHLLQIKTTLEVLVAGQVRTVRTMYTAARAIERQSIVEVLTGIPHLVRTVMDPEKFSFYLLNGATLEAAANEGWRSGDRVPARVSRRRPGVRRGGAGTAVSRRIRSGTRGDAGRRGSARRAVVQRRDRRGVRHAEDRGHAVP